MARFFYLYSLKRCPRNMAATIMVLKGAVKSKVIASPSGIYVTQLTEQITISPPHNPVQNCPNFQFNSIL